MHPICFQIGSRPIYWYGVMMAAAFLAAILHWNWLARRSDKPDNYGYDLAFYLMLAGILGARINYVIANFQDFKTEPLSIIRIDQGGLIYYGGFIGAILAAIIFARVKKEHFVQLADFAITAIPLGHALGRIGCFLNGCCYGTEGTTPWCCLLHDTLRHPVQLYETGWNLLVYVTITLFFLRRKLPGTVFALYLILYPCGRFILEYWRGDTRQMLHGLTTAQAFSLILILTGVSLWSWLLLRDKTVRHLKP